MANRKMSEEQLRKSLAALHAQGSQNAAAASLGLARGTYYNHVIRLRQQGYLTPEDAFTRKGLEFIGEVKGLEFPDLVDDRPTDDEYREYRRKVFQRKFSAKQSREWFPVKVPDEPIGICWFGDPHVDSDGCNWPLLEDHAAICASTPGLYGASLGDVTDNWVGRLTRLYAHSDQSRASAVQGAEIFISKMGIEWLILIRGNHDMWSGAMKNDPLAWMQRGAAPMEDWEAKFRLVFPNGRECHVHGSHHFSGQSWFHPLHGGIRQTLEDGRADLLVSGHTHEFGVMKLAMPKRGTVHCLGKARGYKFIDTHATVHGFGEYDEGASIVSIHNPHARTRGGFLNIFDDVEAAADYLTFLRTRHK